MNDEKRTAQISVTTQDGESVSLGHPVTHKEWMTLHAAIGQEITLTVEETAGTPAPRVVTGKLKARLS